MPFIKGQSGNPSGRKKGSRGTRQELLAARKAEGGALPLDYLLSVMRDETKDVKERTEAAKAAAPYLHRKMPQAIEHSGEIGLAGILTDLAAIRDTSKAEPVVRQSKSVRH